MLYSPVKVTVAEDQIEKLKSSLNKPTLSIKIRLKKFGSAEHNQHTLLLTRGQINSIERTRNAGRRTFKTIRMSRKQIEKNLTHQGGFLGFLASLASKALPMLAKGLATGLVSGAAEQVLGKSGDGLYLFKKGHCIKIDPVRGNGLYLTAHSSGHGVLGDGLYLRRGNAIHNGEGLILGKNSPFKNVPILGWIL